MYFAPWLAASCGLAESESVRANTAQTTRTPRKMDPSVNAHRAIRFLRYALPAGICFLEPQVSRALYTSLTCWERYSKMGSNSVEAAAVNRILRSPITRTKY